MRKMSCGLDSHLGVGINSGKALLNWHRNRTYLFRLLSDYLCVGSIAFSRTSPQKFTYSLKSGTRFLVSRPSAYSDNNLLCHKAEAKIFKFSPILCGGFLKGFELIVPPIFVANKLTENAVLVSPIWLEAMPNTCKAIG